MQGLAGRPEWSGWAPDAPVVFAFLAVAALSIIRAIHAHALSALANLLVTAFRIVSALAFSRGASLAISDAARLVFPSVAYLVSAVRLYRSAILRAVGLVLAAFARAVAAGASNNVADAAVLRAALIRFSSLAFGIRALGAVEGAINGANLVCLSRIAYCIAAGRCRGGLAW